MKNLLKHKNKIILGACILAVLAFTFWWGGNSPSPNEQNLGEMSAYTKSHLAAEEIADDTEAPTSTVEAPTTENEKIQEPVIKQETESNQSTDKDEYQTNPVTEEQAVAVSDIPLTCTLSVRCDTILQNIAWLKEEKVDILSKDGVIFAEKEVVFYEGESVFNVLLREMKKNKIHLEFMNTPIYKSAYIEGIANLYEFDCGELSGWMYRVNDLFPNYGCSRYVLKQGDKIEWLYTCDLGKDIGGGGWQKDE